MRKVITAVLGICMGIGLLITGLVIKEPERKISYYGIEEYVGGDAYNYQIEASILGGEIAGTKIEKAVFIVGGCICLLLSGLALSTNNAASSVQDSSSINNNMNV